MNQGPVNNSVTSKNTSDSASPVMPSREEALIEALREPALVWKSARTREHRSWESGGGSDPRCPDLDPLSDTGILQAASGLRSRSMPRHVGMDWHTVESETLSAQTEQYTVSFKKTAVNSYSHQLRESYVRQWYVAEFVRRDDKDQRLVLDQAKFPVLESLFHEIAARTN
jgi:hypothetical protein